MTLGGLLSLTAREFEARVCGILSDHSYEDIQHVGRTGDLGIDVFATDPPTRAFRLLTPFDTLG